MIHIQTLTFAHTQKASKMNILRKKIDDYDDDDEMMMRRFYIHWMMGLAITQKKLSIYLCSGSDFCHFYRHHHLNVIK